MRNYTLSLLFLFFIGYYSFGQVGINNPDPKATLDITATNTNTTTAEGIIAPRLTGDQVKSKDAQYGADQIGTLIYASAAVTSAPNGKTRNIDSAGYYFFDGSLWLKVASPGDDSNLATKNLTQDAETRTYDMNNQDLNFTNGSFGINIVNPTATLDVEGSGNEDSFRFVQTNSLTGEKDVFTIEDQDVGGGSQDGSSILKILKSGSINSGDDGFSLIELANTSADPGANKYWISGRKNDEGAPLWGVDITDSDLWSTGGIQLGTTSNNNGTYSGGTFKVNSNGSTGIGTISPQKELHIAGNNSTIRIEGLSVANNANNNPEDVVPVYVNNDGDLVTRPSLYQSRMPINLRNFLNPGITISASNGASQIQLLNDSNITLTQPSLVHYSYQVSVSIANATGNAIVDGAPRLYGSFAILNDDGSNYEAYATGTYTNAHVTTTPGTTTTYASGFYYLNGSGYLELPAGTHNLKLFGFGFGGQFGYSMNFGTTPFETIQAVIHR
jgi:hypothetical protein